MNEADDPALVEAALADRNAYARIVARYEPALTRYVRRLLGRAATAVEDVLQDVFIKAYVNLNDYDRSRPFGPWIYRIAHNEAVSHLRARGSRPQVIDGDEGQIILERMAAATGTSDALDLRDREAELHAALNGLDARYRDVLVLRYLEDKSYEDISDILEMPPGTVATRIQRGLKQLRSAYRKKAEHPAHE